MNETKFCKDCRFYHHPYTGLGYALIPPDCLRLGEEAPRNLVSGIPIHPTCDSERSNEDACGREAVYFEAKK